MAFDGGDSVPINITLRQMDESSTLRQIISNEKVLPASL
jgi:hypothetical protein